MPKITNYDFTNMFWKSNVPNVFNNQTFLNGLYENIKNDPTWSFNIMLVKNRIIEKLN